MPGIFDNPRAAAPMFNDVVVVRGSRPGGDSVEQTLNVCVLTDGTGDPLAMESVEADRTDISICVNERDWRFASAIRRGDSVRWNEAEYKVLESKRDAVMGWVVKARGVS